MPYGPKGSEGDPQCIFFTLDTYQETSVSDILWSVCKNLRTNGTETEKDGQTDVKIEIVDHIPY